MDRMYSANSARFFAISEEPASTETPKFAALESGDGNWHVREAPSVCVEIDIATERVLELVLVLET